MICLDTNIIIAVINQRVASVRQRLMTTLHEGTIVGIPTVVLYELWYGIKKSARGRQIVGRLRLQIPLLK